MKIKDNLILPVNKSLLMQFNPMDSVVQAIIPNTNEFINWVCNNYIQILLQPNLRDSYFMFHINPLWECPWLIIDEISQDLFLKLNLDIVEFIINAITKYSYVFMNINPHCLNAYSKIYSYISIHEILIYGYNLNENIFYIADHFNNGNYSYKTCTFEEFKNAYNSSVVSIIEGHPNSIKVLTKVEASKCNSPYCFLPELVKNSLEKYKCGKYAFGLYREYEYSNYYRNCYFGINVYDGLIEMCLKNQNINTPIHYKPFSMLVQHKLIAQYRYNKLSNYITNSSLQDLIIQTYNESLLCQNHIIKCMLKHECTSNTIIKQLNNLKLKDIEMTELFIDCLSSI